ncbi:cytochrome P450 [Microtetraspora sp. NBRC 13810]|nr:cytochrome P450 [Microtetraspora sp. NBRC 13810]
MEADGEIVRLNAGTFRPYVITHPEHVHHVLRGNSDNYVRDGAFWRPFRPLFGNGILSDGASWERSRNALQPMFTARHVESLTGLMADAVADALERLDPLAAAGHPIDVSAELTKIVNSTLVGIFFGDRISLAETERLLPAMERIGNAVVLRIMLPLVPKAVPLPGDRSFRSAVRAFDDVMASLARRHPVAPRDGDDVFTLLCRARDASGGELDSGFVRDNLVAMFATSIETTIMALTWLWPQLAAHPEVSRRLSAEIREVVGGDRVSAAHLPGLGYTRMVFQELLRLYPVAWMFPRMVVRREVLGGVRLDHGDNVLISPYLTHRLPSLWDRALDFDPERFAPSREERRHRYAYFPFGGGPHQCIGAHVFNTMGQLIVAGLISRFQPEPDPAPARPRPAVTLRPRDSVKITLRRVPEGVR